MARPLLSGHEWGAVAGQLAMLHAYFLLKAALIINMPHPQVMNNPLKSRYAGFFQLPLLPEGLCRIFHFRGLKKGLLRTSRKGTFAGSHL
jgi:epoxide hydrolase 4